MTVFYQLNNIVFVDICDFSEMSLRNYARTLQLSELFAVVEVFLASVNRRNNKNWSLLIWTKYPI